MRLLFPVLFSLLTISTGLFLEYDRFSQTALRPAQPIIMQVPRGMSLRHLSERLVALGVLDQPYYFMLLAYLRGDAKRVQAGTYALRSGMKPAEVLDLLVSGRVVQQPVTLIEGWTVQQALNAIARNPKVEHRLKPATPQALMAALGKPELAAEGRFLPDTYHFPKGVTDVAVFRRAYAAMETFLAREWPKRAPDLPLANPYEALILASIVEKETGKAEERPQIAGVFIRRLRRGMKLQTDPTVIYGLGADFDGNLRRADLRKDTPYNTYVHWGLPPTPIALPGRAAILAVLHPQPGDSLYFVAKGDGSHQFSTTLKEHNRAVRRYQLRKSSE